MVAEPHAAVPVRWPPRRHVARTEGGRGIHRGRSLAQPSRRNITVQTYAACIWKYVLTCGMSAPATEQWNDCYDLQHGGVCEPVAGTQACGAQVHQVSVRRLRQLMRSGDMMLPSVSTCSFALDELSSRGLL